MLKKVFLFTLLPLIVFADRLIFTSIYPLELIVKEIAGNSFRVESLLRGSADYHFYELSSGDILKLSKAEIIIVSSELEPWERKISQVFGRDKKVLILLKKEETLKGDTHFWLSPKSVLRIADRIYEKIASLNSTDKQYYNKRYKKFESELHLLDEMFEEMLGTCRLKTLVSTHPAFTYLARDYGIKQVAPAEGEAHGGLSLKFLKEVMRLKEEGKVKYVLVPTDEGSKLVKLLESKGIKPKYIDIKLSSYGDYFSGMKDVLKTLSEVLECKKKRL